MFRHPKWDIWPCTHACTAFFHIAPDEVRHLVPEPLVLAIDRKGRAAIELGYVRFRGGIHDLPATEEMAWAVAVKREKGFGLAFAAMNIAADNEAFLAHNAGIGFAVHRPPVRFQTDLDRRSYRVEDDTGPICTVRHQPEGSIPLPFFPMSTEVWTRSPRGLERRLFRWRGPAYAHVSPLVASTLCDHPFFLGARVSRATPVPYQVFASQRTATRAAQLFTKPVLSES